MKISLNDKKKIALIVEGHHDASHINLSVGFKFDFVVLNGTRFTNRTRMDIDKAIRLNEKVFILTDPDEAGDIIAGKIQEAYPQLERIIVDKDKCQHMTRNYRMYTGVEHAHPRYLRELFAEHNLL